MKTHIIRLERYDDVISTQDKMSWSKVPRILLVWPEKGSPLDQRMDLVLLQRFAQRLGAQLALVTINQNVIANAKLVGIPVFENIDNAQRKTWRRNRLRQIDIKNYRVIVRDRLRDLKPLFTDRSPQKTNSLPVRLAVFLLAICAILGLIIFFLPGAKITITPKEQEQSMVLQIWASPSIETPNLSGGIPAQQKTFIVEGMEDIKSSGKQEIPDQFANGTIEFTNLTDQEIKVPAGTIVRTLNDPAVRFKTLQEIVIPAKGEKKKETAIQAVDPGSSSNVDSNQIRGIEGALGTFIVADNQLATVGGTDRETPSPTDADYQTVRQRLLDQLGKTALNEMEPTMGVDEMFLPATLEVDEVLLEERTPKEGSPGDRLNLRMKVKFNVWVSSLKDVEMVSTTALNANMAENMISVPGSLKVIPVRDAVVKDGRAQWEVQATRLVKPTWSQEAISGSIIGKSPMDAKQTIQDQLVLQKTPEFIIQPSWWPRLPFFTSRIQVVEK